MKHKYQVTQPPHSPISRVHSTLQAFAFASDNLLQSLTTPNVLSVMVLSIVFGLAIAHVTPHAGQSRVLAEVMAQVCIK